MARTGLTGAAWLLLAGLSAAGAEGSGPNFTKKPVPVREKGGVRIEFAVDRPTDVAVFIEDDQGKVVRHLVAGAIGDAPPEPLKPGLSQSLLWDGNDDHGDRPAGRSFRARVALGMLPKLEKVIGGSPANLGGVVGLAVGPRGELFVLHSFGALHPGDSSSACSVFDRRGKYLRTIMPYPADLPAAKTSALKKVDTGDGRRVPYWYNAETRALVPGGGPLIAHQPAVSTDGRLIFIGHQEQITTCSRYNQPGLKQVTVINSDGSTPAGGVLGAVLARNSQGGGCLAVSPDGEVIYASGLRTGRSKAARPLHAAYRFGWSDREPPVFVGNPKTPGAGAAGLSEPRGVGVDGSGNVYIADRGNNRVAVFSSEGTHLGDVKVEGPDAVCVHPRSGTVYVAAGARERKLLKFASWRASGPSAEVKLPFHKRDVTCLLALDASADPPVLWYSTPRATYLRFKALRIEDRGDTFGDPTALGKLSGVGQGVGPVRLVSMDRRRNRLFINGTVFDLATGKASPAVRKMTGAKDGMGSVGLDGNLYLMSYPNNLRRYGPKLEAIPFTGHGTAKGAAISPGKGSTRLRPRGVHADPAGNVYALWEFREPRAGTWGQSNSLTLHAPDGSVKKERLISSDVRMLNSVRVDYRGNIYLAMGVRPEGRKLPDTFVGQDLGPDWNSRGTNTDGMNWYPLMYGCIVKFGPEGGEVKQGNGGTPVDFSYALKTNIKGAKWIRYGASPVASWRQKYPDTCLCESPRFDVDEFGRSFFPDVGRFQVGVLDTAGNELCRFGGYGNSDSAGPGSRVPLPDIPLCWADNVAAGNGHVYIGDRLNRRVVAVRLEYADEKTCGL
jgi:DNA-binding beta-propeller fold protein YncE